MGFEWQSNEEPIISSLLFTHSLHSTPFFKSQPETHDSQEIHTQFQNDVKSSGDDYSPKDQLFLSKPTVLGTLSKGSCAIFDSRLLHAGGANTSNTKKSRALLYCTFQNPNVTNVGNPGSIRPNLMNQWTLQKLQKELVKYQNGKPSEVYAAE